MSTEQDTIQEQTTQEVKPQKIDSYQVQAWATEPLAQMKSSTAHQALKTISIRKLHNSDQEFVIGVVEGESLTQIHATVYEGGILRFQVKNPKNIWDFQLDDVVGPLNLRLNSKAHVSINEHTDHYSIHIGELISVRVHKNPFELSFWLHENEHPFMRADTLTCNGTLSLKTRFDSSFLCGIPEHPDHYDLADTTNDKPYRLYNLDRYLWPIHSKGSLYGTAPIIVSHNQQRTAGFFWRNSTETYVNIKKGETHSHADWLSEQGDLDFVVFADFKVTGFYNKLAKTIGHSILPQLFTLGYQHSRYSFKDQTDVENVDKKFQELGIPYDVIYLDIDHCDQKRYFSFDKSLYPEVDLMIKNLEKQGKSVSTIVDPHVLIDQGYYVHSESKKELDFFIKSPDQSDFVGTCWPGPCNWLDFLNEDVRKYWAGLYAFSKYKHSTTNFGTWNDMNEPAVFKGIEETMNKDNIHTIKNKSRKYQVPHTFVHNLYGYSQTKASYQGLVERDSEKHQKRPLILTRSWWVGSQKNAAIWTADSEAKWEYLNIHTPMLLSFSSVGFPYCGADVGGFEGNPPEDLHVRWYQAGAFQPFFRGHSSTFCDRREPWLYSDQTLNNIRKAIQTRYEFLPYWYSEFFKHTFTGMPVLRALWQNYPYRTDLYKEEQIYMIGDEILVAPIVKEGQTSVTFNDIEGRWYDYNNNFNLVELKGEISDVPLDTIPVFFKGSSIILLYNILRSEQNYKSGRDTFENCPLYLVICLNELQQAESDYYMDNGSSLRSQENGEYSKTNFIFKNGTLNVDVESKYGDPYWPTKIEQVFICGIKEAPILPENMRMEGNTLIVSNISISLNHNSENVFF